MGKTNLPGIPETGPGLDPQVQAVLRPIKEVVETREGRRGAPLERGVTLRDLVRIGVLTEEQALKLC
jgi:hypothetical protein